MNKKILIGLVIIAVLLGGYLVYYNLTKEKPQPSKIEKNDIVISSATVQGVFANTYLFHDGTFLIVNTLPWGDPQKCVEGIISEEQYDSFIEFVKSSGFFNAKIIPENPGCLGEGISWVYVYVGGLTNQLTESCETDGAKNELTIEALSIKDEISSRLAEITVGQEVCKQGGYIETHNLEKSCEKYKEWYDEELEYDVYEFSDLDTNLQNSLKNENAIIYIGPINETIESYHRKYYEIDSSCYFVFLYGFDGNLFRSYDEIIRE